MATLLFAGCMSPIGADIYQGEDLNPPVTFRPFVLESDDGSQFNSSNVSGKVLIVGFIYVNCPDVCPTTTSDMAWIQSQLGETERNKTRFLSITV
ncbi:MAG: SCO family protein, partial [Euryarchaeota archaeon]